MASGLGGCASCIKYCLFAFNLLFWLIGCALVGVGIWIVVDSKKFIEILTQNVSTDVQNTLGASSEDAVRILGIVAIVVGGVILILGFLGCCGAIRESQVLLSIFFAFLLIIFLILITIGILVFVYSDKLQTWLRDAMQKEIDENVSNGLMNYSHEKYGCCGIDDAIGGICRQDYPPTSQCKAGSFNCANGCFSPLWSDLDKMKFGLGIALLVSGGITLLGLIFSMCLCCSIRSSTSYSY